MTYENTQEQIEMKFEKNITLEVEAVGQMHFEGNVIPHMWYHNIKFPNGKTDLVSICILAEIVYWYRPTYERDETTGKLISINKKFEGDALRKSKEDLAEHLGLSERQVKESLARLEKLGVIEREFRTLKKDRLILPNVCFIKLNPLMLKEVTFDKLPYDFSMSYTPSTPKNDLDPPIKRRGGGMTFQRQMI